MEPLHRKHREVVELDHAVVDQIAEPARIEELVMEAEIHDAAIGHAVRAGRIVGQTEHTGLAAAGIDARTGAVLTGAAIGSGRSRPAYR